MAMELKDYHHVGCPGIDVMERCRPVSLLIPGRPAALRGGEPDPMCRMTLIGKMGRYGYIHEPVIVIELLAGKDVFDVDQWRRIDEPTPNEKWLFMELLDTKQQLARATAREDAFHDKLRELQELNRTIKSNIPLAEWRDTISKLVANAHIASDYDTELGELLEQLEEALK